MNKPQQNTNLNEQILELKAKRNLIFNSINNERLNEEAAEKNAENARALEAKAKEDLGIAVAERDKAKSDRLLELVLLENTRYTRDVVAADERKLLKKKNDLEQSIADLRNQKIRGERILREGLALKGKEIQKQADLLHEEQKKREAEYKEFVERNDRAREDLRQTEQKNQDIFQGIELQKHTLEKLNGDIESARLAKVSAEDELRASQSTLAALKKEIADFTAARESNNKVLDQLETQKKDAEGKINDLKKQSEDITKRLGAIGTKEQELQERESQYKDFCKKAGIPW